MHKINKELLFKPCKIGNIEIKNRIVMAPITPNLAAPNGLVTNDLISFYETRAKGGVGLIVTGWAFIGDESSRDIGLQIGINNNRFMPSLNSFTEAIHKWGTKIFIQLSYVGRKIKDRKNPKHKKNNSIEYLIGSDYDLYQPQELTPKEIENIARLYGEAALRAKNAGFDGVEIAGTQEEIFYLFLLKEFNKRKDMYGGRLESRILFLLKILEYVKYYVGKEYPIGLRFTGFEDQHYLNNKIINESEAKKIAQILEKKAISYLNVFRSVLPAYVTKREYCTSQAIKEIVNIPVIATGSIIEPEQAEDIIFNNVADFVALGRELIADPHWANKVNENKNKDIIKCIRCNECLSRVIKLQDLRCTVNMNTVVGEKQKSFLIPRSKKRIAIIGGGPSGIKAAIIASKRGHDVTLFEKRNILGGNLIPASEPKFKFDFKNLLNQLQKDISNTSVSVILNKEISRIDSIIEKFDKIILATGAVPKKLNVPIEDKNKIYFYYDAICNPENIKGKNVIIIGGGLIGCETALFLKDIGKKIQIIEVEEDILLEEHDFFKKSELILMLKNSSIKIYRKTRVRKIYKDVVEISKNNKIFFVPFDSIIITIGLEPNKILLNEEKNKINSLYLIGDCKEVGNLYKASHDGYSIGSII